jgi:hypothetical protein
MNRNYFPAVALFCTIALPRALHSSSALATEKVNGLRNPWFTVSFTFAFTRVHWTAATKRKR